LVSVVEDETVRGIFLQCWKESQPGTAVAHEEGGFVLQGPDGSLGVEQWPRGAQDRTVVPPHPGGRRGNLLIVATFHTHPNPGPDYQQEPSLTDVRAVHDDPDLSHAEYEGEYVIASAWVYRIRRNGQVDTVGLTKAVLNAESPGQPPG
jgi:hypothetical protein